MSKQIKDQVTLKSLQTRLEKERAELAVIRQQQSELKYEEKTITARIGSIEKQIRNLSKENLIMSEHAIIRYLQRVKLVPIGDVEKEVITEELIRMWKILGNGTYPLGDSGATAIIKNGIITTINK